MLLVNDIKFSRSEKIIYENINFSASPGKIIFIKLTLIHCSVQNILMIKLSCVIGS